MAGAKQPGLGQIAADLAAVVVLDADDGGRGDAGPIMLIYAAVAAATYPFVRAYELLDPAVTAAIWPLYWIARIVSLGF